MFCFAAVEAKITADRAQVFVSVNQTAILSCSLPYEDKMRYGDWEYNCGDDKSGKLVYGVVGGWTAVEPGMPFEGRVHFTAIRNQDTMTYILQIDHAQKEDECTLLVIKIMVIGLGIVFP